MRQWMVAAKKADFYAIAEKFHVDPVVARIIRNREVIGEKNIRIYLGGNLSDLSDQEGREKTIFSTIDYFVR